MDARIVEEVSREIRRHRAIASDLAGQLDKLREQWGKASREPTFVLASWRLRAPHTIGIKKGLRGFAWKPSAVALGNTDTR